MTTTLTVDNNTGPGGTPGVSPSSARPATTVGGIAGLFTTAAGAVLSATGHATPGVDEALTIVGPVVTAVAVAARAWLTKIERSDPRLAADYQKVEGDVVKYTPEAAAAVSALAVDVPGLSDKVNEIVGKVNQHGKIISDVAKAVDEVKSVVPQAVAKVEANPAVQAVEAGVQKVEGAVNANPQPPAATPSTPLPAPAAAVPTTEATSDGLPPIPAGITFAATSTADAAAAPTPPPVPAAPAN